MIDCRSEEGQTIGLIDALIHISREVARDGLWDEEVRNALADLWADESFKFVREQAEIAYQEWENQQ